MWKQLGLKKNHLRCETKFHVHSTIWVTWSCRCIFCSAFLWYETTEIWPIVLSALWWGYSQIHNYCFGNSMKDVLFYRVHYVSWHIYNNVIESLGDISRQTDSKKPYHHLYSLFEWTRSTFFHLLVTCFKRFCYFHGFLCAAPTFSPEWITYRFIANLSTSILSHLNSPSTVLPCGLII